MGRKRCSLRAIFPFPSVFNRLILQTRKKTGLVWDRVNAVQCLKTIPGYPFSKQALVFTCLQYMSFENTVGKGEIARIEQFPLFPQCFLPVGRTFFHFNQI